jgi:hypothetical protein
VIRSLCPSSTTVYAAEVIAMTSIIMAHTTNIGFTAGDITLQIGSGGGGGGGVQRSENSLWQKRHPPECTELKPSQWRKMVSLRTFPNFRAVCDSPSVSVSASASASASVSALLSPVVKS